MPLTPPHLRNRKRTRDKAELAVQVGMFRSTGRSGDKLLTWLRLHEDQLAELLYEG